MSERVRFPGAHGVDLAGRIDMPEGPPRAWALFAHCFTCTKNLKAVGNISRSLNDAAIAVLRFDFTGLGESEGEFAETNFSSNVEDLVAAAAFLEREHTAPALLVGHSLGGAAVIHAATRIASVTAVATIAAPADTEHVKQLIVGRTEEIESDGDRIVELAGRRFTIGAQFLRDVEEQNMDAAITGLGRALLILHSPLDRIVAIDNAARIFTTARHPKSFVSLDGADHLLTREEDSRWAGAIIGAWAERYLS